MLILVTTTVITAYTLLVHIPSQLEPIHAHRGSRPSPGSLPPGPQLATTPPTRAPHLAAICAPRPRRPFLPRVSLSPPLGSVSPIPIESEAMNSSRSRKRMRQAWDGADAPPPEREVVGSLARSRVRIQGPLGLCICGLSLLCERRFQGAACRRRGGRTTATGITCSISARTWPADVSARLFVSLVEAG
jgi:hypothetical protein